MSRIADVLEKARLERARRGESQPPFEVRSRIPLRRSSDVRVPWSLEDAPINNPGGRHDAERLPERAVSAPAIHQRPAEPNPATSVPAALQEPDRSGHGRERAQGPEFKPSWQEAVAIVREIAARLRSNLAVPLPGQLALDENGSPILRPGRSLADDPVQQLAILLEWLLTAAAPPPALAKLAADSARNAPPYSSVTQFSSALAYYEPPRRNDVLRGIAARMHASIPGARVGMLKRLGRALASVLRFRTSM